MSNFADMKFLSSIILSCILCQLPCVAQQKRALIVAIADYPKHSGWNKIHANNDLTILLPTLEKQGFKRKNIIVLTDNQANKKNIIQALQVLDESCKEGDYVFIHFSCHGQQMEDDNGDEIDGLDESLVPYDAEMHFRKGKYEGENHIRDDELEAMLFSIRKKIKDDGSLIVSLDACHSQSGSRGMNEEVVVRGTPVIFSGLGYQGINKMNNKDTPLLQWQGLAPITIISACKSYQQNYEYKSDNDQYYGSLTYSICNVTSPQNIFSSLPQWLEDLEKKMRRIMKYQTPVIETTLQ